MSRGLLFWILMACWLIFGGWHFWPGADGNWHPFSGVVLLFVLLLLIGWQVFGPPIKG